MKPERSRTLALGGLLGGAGLSFLAGAQPWWQARGEGLNVALSGTTSTGGVSQALALATAAGALLLLTLGSRGRRVLVVILVLLGVAMAVLGALRVRPNQQAVQDQVRTVSLANQFFLAPTVWPSIYAAAGVLITFAGAITIVWSGRWPQRSGRFQVGGGSTATPAEQLTDAWAAMDAGLDPTEDVSSAPARRPDPDVQSGPDQDTMGDTKPSTQSQRSAE